MPARETKQKSATVAARKQTLSTLLVAAGKLQRANDTIKAIQTLNEAGHLQLDLFLQTDALSTFQQSYELLEQGMDSITRVDTLNGLATAYLAVNKYQEAQPLLETARTIRRAKQLSRRKSRSSATPQRMSKLHESCRRSEYGR